MSEITFLFSAASETQKIFNIIIVNLQASYL